MSKTPRIIAASASAALLAATGAGAAVFTVETVTAHESDAASTQQAADTLGSPQNDRTTVYRSPGQGSNQQNLQQAPPSTSWNGQSQQPNKAGKSHSS